MINNETMAYQELANVVLDLLKIENLIKLSVNVLFMKEWLKTNAG